MTVAGFRFERRAILPWWVRALVPLISAALALIVAGLMLTATGYHPLSVYRQMYDIAFGSSIAISATLVAATPILLTGLATAVAFRMNARNIGGEGQLYVGAAAATAAGIAVGHQSSAIAIPAMVLAGMLAGSVWILVPALLRAYLRTSELITTLMLNYVGGLLVTYLIFDSTSYVRDTTSAGGLVYPQGRMIGYSAMWPAITGSGLVIPFGFLLGLVCAAVLFVIMRFSLLGFHIRVIGDSTSAGRYSGIPTSRVFVTVMLISGALAGLAGASQVGDLTHTLDPRGLQAAQYAWTGIVVAAVVAYNPLGVVPSAIIIGGLVNAGLALQGSSFPLGLVGAIEGIVLFGVACGLVLSHYRPARTSYRRPSRRLEPAPEVSVSPAKEPR
jgi:general nucleoside transport system permease protein